MTEAAQTLTVRVPFVIRKRGGRKLAIAADGTTLAPPRPRIDNTLVKALARAHRWNRLLESGRYGTAAELAAAEKINPSYVSRVLRLTLLAPDIVEAIVEGRQADGVETDVLLQPFSAKWAEQRRLLPFSAPRVDVSSLSTSGHFVVSSPSPSRSYRLRP